MDVLPKDFIPGDALWMEQKPLFADPDLHNMNYLIKHPNATQDVRAVIDNKEPMYEKARKESHVKKIFEKLHIIEKSN